MASLQRRDFDGAITQFSALIQAGSRNPIDFDARGTAYSSKQPSDADSAMADFTRAIALSGHDWRPHAKRAMLFAARGQYKEALNDLNAAINDHAGSDASLFFIRGRVHQSLRDSDRAWQDFNKTIELAPDNAEAYLLRGQESANYYRELIEKCRKETESQRNLEIGGRCSRPINFSEAQADFRTAFAKNPRLAQAPYELGRIMNELNRNEDAVQAYTDAIRVNPNYALAYNNRGVAYNKLKKRELAFADFNEAIRLDQRVAAAWVNRGDMFANDGQRQRAISDYRKALDIDGNFAPALERLKRMGIRP